jgi:1,4-alpha-glucan branching enzyme
MYGNMSEQTPSHIIDRALALHKMIRFITVSCAGEGYLNFMGNEFGHPEWIDFPREGNNSSYHYARRQWGLADDGNLKYRYLNAFDGDMIKLIRENNLTAAPSRLILHARTHNVLIYEKGGFIFIFNFHPSSLYKTHIVREEYGEYKIIMNTGWESYGGWEPVDEKIIKTEKPENSYALCVTVGSRSAVAVKKVRNGS